MIFRKKESLSEKLTREYNESLINQIKEKLDLAREFILSKKSEEFRAKEHIVLQFMAAVKILHVYSEIQHDIIVETEMASEHRANITDEDVQQFSKDIDKILAGK